MAGDRRRRLDSVAAALSRGLSGAAPALAGVDVRPLDDPLGRAAGELAAVAGLSDVIDAAVVLLATDGDDIVTTDRKALEHLVFASGRHVELIGP